MGGINEIYLVWSAYIIHRFVLHLMSLWSVSLYSSHCFWECDAYRYLYCCYLAASVLLVLKFFFVNVTDSEFLTNICVPKFVEFCATFDNRNKMDFCGLHMVLSFARSSSVFVSILKSRFRCRFEKKY